MFNKKRLIEIMEEKGISAYRLWKTSGVAQSTISDILNKVDKNPTAKTLQKIAAALDVPVDEFFKPTEESNDKDKGLTDHESTVLANDLDDDKILTLAAHQAGHEGPLSEEDKEKIKLAIKIALAKDNKHNK